jgi:hypothetical protein
MMAAYPPTTQTKTPLAPRPVASGAIQRGADQLLALVEEEKAPLRAALADARADAAALRAGLAATARERDAAIRERDALQAALEALRQRSVDEAEAEAEAEANGEEEAEGDEETDCAAVLGMTQAAFDALPPRERRRHRNRVSADKSRKKHRGKRRRAVFLA